jgi:hypothetical protein
VEHPITTRYPRMIESLTTWPWVHDGCWGQPVEERRGGSDGTSERPRSSHCDFYGAEFHSGSEGRYGAGGDNPRPDLPTETHYDVMCICAASYKVVRGRSRRKICSSSSQTGISGSQLWRWAIPTTLTLRNMASCPRHPSPIQILSGPLPWEGYHPDLTWRKVAVQTARMRS